MQLLVFLANPSAARAVADYLSSYGCSVDSAVDLDHAESLLRFRAYDSVVADREEVNENVVALARKKNRRMVPILLTTDRVDARDSVVALTKPLPLAQILDTIREAQAPDQRR